MLSRAVAGGEGIINYELGIMNWEVARINKSNLLTADY
ncbi:hypothetical protein N44_04100 [Microcystis aeruginosa NIES-44]|uniref:Uncharacterized protein n=1 Tax=Microcystis aeruginosa NIES-44 TaxID=449439 RepID=A0A0A1VZR8_MICAE|nr:hypothetical protein N44_04100 [Microcystis aeruginosa NIES-44]